MKRKKTINQKKVLVPFLILLFTICLSVFTDVHALDIRRSVLSNGLTVLYVERHNLPIITASLLVKASPLDESRDKAGLANLTAELLTEGTEKRKALEISEEIEFIGASLGAATNEDYTVISLSVLKKDVQKGFEIFSDVVLNPTFPDEEIRRNRELIKGSLKQSEEEPSFVASKAFKNAVYGDLSYGRLIRGSIESLDRITREDIVRFHSDLYRPNNAVLSVVGDLTEDELSALIKRFLSLWQQGDIAKRASVEQPRNKKQTLLVDRELTQANIIVGHSGIKRGNPDYYAASVMNYILGGGGFSSRLMQTVRDEMGLAYDIHSFFAPYKEGGLFEVGVQTKNESAKTVIGEIHSQMNRIRKDKVSEQELNDAKSYLTGSFPRKLDTNRKIADFLVAIEFYELGLDYVDKYPQYIRSVTADDVLRVAGKYLDTQDLVTVVVGKQSKISLNNQ